MALISHVLSDSEYPSQVFLYTNNDDYKLDRKCEGVASNVCSTTWDLRPLPHWMVIFSIGAFFWRVRRWLQLAAIETAVSEMTSSLPQRVITTSDTSTTRSQKAWKSTTSSFRVDFGPTRTTFPAGKSSMRRWRKLYLPAFGAALIRTDGVR